jgi:hypothetical protein
MYSFKLKNFHVVSPSTLNTNANHLGDMVRWGGSCLILLEDKTKHEKLKNM